MQTDGSGVRGEAKLCCDGVSRVCGVLGGVRLNVVMGVYIHVIQASSDASCGVIDRVVSCRVASGAEGALLG